IQLLEEWCERGVVQRPPAHRATERYADHFWEDEGALQLSDRGVDVRQRDGGESGVAAPVLTAQVDVEIVRQAGRLDRVSFGQAVGRGKGDREHLHVDTYLVEQLDSLCEAHPSVRHRGRGAAATALEEPHVLVGK